MSWKDEYRTALTGFMLKQGTVMALYVYDAQTESYLDYSGGPAVREHLTECIVIVDKLEESTFSTGADTFNEGTEGHGFDMTVTCACGQVTERRIRYEGIIGEALLGLLNEEE